MRNPYQTGVMTGVYAILAFAAWVFLVS